MNILILCAALVTACAMPAFAQRDSVNRDSMEFKRAVDAEVARVLRSLGVRTSRDSLNDDADTVAHRDRGDSAAGASRVVIGDNTTEPVTFFDWQAFNAIRYNRVDGFFLGAGSSSPRSASLEKLSEAGSHGQRNFLRGQLGLGYAFGSHFWTVEGGLSLLHYVSDPLSSLPIAFELGGEGHVRTDTRDAWLVSAGENTFSSLIAHEDFQDYFKRKGWSVTGAIYIGKEQLSVQYRTDSYFSMHKHEYWSLFGGDKRYRENPVVTEGRIPSLVLTAYSDNVRRTRLWRGWTALVQAEIASGDMPFHRYILDIRRYQPVTRWAAINARVRAAAVQGSELSVTVSDTVGQGPAVTMRVPFTPAQEFFGIGGISTLPAFHYKEFAGNRMMLVNAEMNFSGRALHELIGFPFEDLTVMVLMDAGMAFQVDDRLGATEGWEQLSLPNFRSDFGFALGSENGLFRIGALWRSDKGEGAKFFVRFDRPF